ncbi:unnamed protein product [Gadus morhua 'NCC']
MYKLGMATIVRRTELGAYAQMNRPRYCYRGVPSPTPPERPRELDAKRASQKNICLLANRGPHTAPTLEGPSHRPHGWRGPNPAPTLEGPSPHPHARGALTTPHSRRGPHTRGALTLEGPSPRPHARGALTPPPRRRALTPPPRRRGPHPAPTLEGPSHRPHAGGALTPPPR